MEQAALQAVAAGRQLLAADLAPPEKAAPAPALPATAAEFYELWQAHHPHKPASSKRQYKQVMAHLDAYHPSWAVTTLTHPEFQAYLSHLHRLGLADATVTKHVKFQTGDELRLPLPPQAAAIWDRLGGQPFVPVQQYRNRHMKQLMELAGLTRPFVQVTYVANKPVEQVLPLWQVVTTHTARHTGADLIMLGSGGDSDLKEKALGHAAVYGHDNLERYGPLLLSAWVQVLGAMPDFAPNFSANQP